MASNELTVKYVDVLDRAQAYELIEDGTDKKESILELNSMLIELHRYYSLGYEFEGSDQAEKISIWLDEKYTSTDYHSRMNIDKFIKYRHVRMDIEEDIKQIDVRIGKLLENGDHSIGIQKTVNDLIELKMDEVIAKYNNMLSQPPDQFDTQTDAENLLIYTGSQKYGGKDTDPFKIIKYFNAIKPGRELYGDEIANAIGLNYDVATDRNRISTLMTGLIRKKLFTFREAHGVRVYKSMGRILYESEIEIS